MDISGYFLKVLLLILVIVLKGICFMIEFITQLSSYILKPFMVLLFLCLLYNLLRSQWNQMMIFVVAECVCAGFLFGSEWISSLLRLLSTELMKWL